MKTAQTARPADRRVAPVRSTHQHGAAVTVTAMWAGEHQDFSRLTAMTVVGTAVTAPIAGASSTRRT